MTISPESHSQLLKLCALLLDYPRPEVREESLALHALIRTSDLPEAQRDGLAALLNELCQGDLLDVQARYDGLFERGRSVSLLLFEHVHGESRDRGQAMVDLLHRYNAAGLAIHVNELPDYLPLYLEFLALQDAEGARVGLDERGSAYAAVFHGLLELSGERPDLAGLHRDCEQEARDDSLEALDKAWEETQVSFGEPAAGCPSNPRQPSSALEQPLQWVAQPVPPRRVASQGA
jgi:nitrate reductase delta subunit